MRFPKFVFKITACKSNSLYIYDYFSLIGTSRKLLQINDSDLQGFERENCTAPAINEFPSDGLTREQRQNGYLVIHIIVAAYSFVLLAVVCDDFFVPSITKICESKCCMENFIMKIYRRNWPTGKKLTNHFFHGLLLEMASNTPFFDRYTRVWSWASFWSKNI